MSFSDGRSFLISRRIGFGRASVPSKQLAQLRTVPRFWDEPFLLRVPMQIAFGCFYQRIPKFHFRRRLRRPRRLRTSLRLLLLSQLQMQQMLLLLMTDTATWAASTAGASAVANVATPTACQKRKTCPLSHQGFIKAYTMQVSLEHSL
jgi:hypothetical protein